MSKVWYCVHVIVPQKQLDHFVSAAEQQINPLSVGWEAASAEVLLEPPPGEVWSWQLNRVTLMYDDLAATTRAHQWCQQTFPDYPVELTEMADENWVTAWQKHYQPISISDRFQIQPYDIDAHGTEMPSSESAESGPTLLRLNPGLAFGSGSHPTTFLCLQQLIELQVKGRTWLDFGCGSGILGLALLKLGAKKVYFVDYDEQALNATVENAKLNDICSTQYALSKQLPSQTVIDSFDGIVANVLTPPLIEFADEFTSRLAHQSPIILSGIYGIEQVKQVTTAYAALSSLHHVENDQWYCLVGQK